MTYGLLKNNRFKKITFEPLKLSPNQKKLTGDAWFCDYCEDKKDLYQLDLDGELGCLCLKDLNIFINEQLTKARLPYLARDAEVKL